MNIVMFSNTYLPHVGGVARSVNFFAGDLRKLGHRVLVVAPHFENESDEEENVLRVPAVQNFNGSDFSVRIPTPFLVENAIENFEPDIIHSHHPFLLGDTALRSARKHDLPLVFTHHTMYEKYTHYVPFDFKKLQEFVINLVTLYTDFCNHVVAPSDSVAEILRSRDVTRPVSVIPTGVDTEFFSGGDRGAFRKAHGIPPEARVVGYVGRLAPEKNMAFVAEAVARYIGRHSEALFLVVGGGPGDLEVIQAFEKAGIADRLVMAGEMRGDSLADAYCAMDLFAFASKSETQGMVLTEAMAAGLPVIALDAPGVREVVADDVNGRLLPADSTPGDFERALSKGLEDSTRRNRWKKEALDTSRAFSRDTCARRMVKLYEEVAACHAGLDPVDESRFNALEGLLQRLNTEWELVAQKTRAAAEAMKG